MICYPALIVQHATPSSTAVLLLLTQEDIENPNLLLLSVFYVFTWHPTPGRSPMLMLVPTSTVNRPQLLNKAPSLAPSFRYVAPVFLALFERWR